MFQVYTSSHLGAESVKTSLSGPTYLYVLGIYRIDTRFSTNTDLASVVYGLQSFSCITYIYVQKL